MEEKESSKAAEAAQGLSASLSKQPAMEEEKEDPKAGEAAQGFTASLSNWSSAIKPTTEAPLDLNTRESEESWQEKQKQSLQQHNGMNLEGEMAAIMGGSKYASIGQAPSAVKQSQDWGDEGDVCVFPTDGGEMKVEFNAEQEEYTTEAQFAHGTDTDDVHISVAWLLKNHSKMYRVKPDEDLNGIFVDFKALAPDKPRKLLFSFEDKSVEATDTAKKLGLKNGATIYAYTEEEEEEANKIDMPLGNINVNIGYYDQEFSLDGVSMDTLMEAVFKEFHKVSDTEYQSEQLEFIHDGYKMEPTHTPGDFKMQDGDWIFVSRIDDAEKISSNDEGKPKKVCISLVMDRYEVSMTVKI
jgi:hypothetical protein